MQREEGESRHDSSLSGGNHAGMQTIVGRSYTAALYQSNDASAIGSFRVGSASQASRIIPALPMCVTPLGLDPSSGVEDSVSYSGSEKEIPLRIVRVTFGGWSRRCWCSSLYRYERYSFVTVNSNLTGAKLGIIPTLQWVVNIVFSYELKHRRYGKNVEKGFGSEI